MITIQFEFDVSINIPFSSCTMAPLSRCSALYVDETGSIPAF